MIFGVDRSPSFSPLEVTFRYGFPAAVMPVPEKVASSAPLI